MYESHSAEYTRMYESIVIEFFLRLKHVKIQEVGKSQDLIWEYLKKNLLAW